MESQLNDSFGLKSKEVAHHRSRIMLDFDGTVASNMHPDNPLDSAILENGAKEHLIKLSEHNDLYIYTARLDPDLFSNVAKQKEAILELMRFHDIPVKDVLMKPWADLYIDDLALNFSGCWDSFQQTNVIASFARSGKVEIYNLPSKKLKLKKPIFANFGYDKVSHSFLVSCDVLKISVSCDTRIHAVQNFSLSISELFFSRLSKSSEVRIYLEDHILEEV